MKRIGVCLFLCLTLLLTGCVSSMPGERKRAAQPLPTVRPGPEAPVGDTQSGRTVSAVLYLPSDDGSTLSATVREVYVDAGESEHEMIVRTLLEMISESVFSGGQQLRLASVSCPVEVTGEIATVNLNTSARVLGIEALYALRMAITNTLTELPGVQYVNTLINGWDTGLDVAMTLPVGVMARYPSGDIAAFWSQVETQRAAENSELQKTAALYFASSDGSAMMAEPRNLTFEKREQAVYAQKLLEELSAGAMQLSDTRTLVPPTDYFERNAELNEAGDGQRTVAVYFREEVDDFLLLRESTRAQMLMTICYTLTSFMPRLDGVVAYIGGVPLTELTLPDGSLWSAGDGVLRRDAFSAFAADVRNIYYPLADGSGLMAEKRPIAQRYRTAPRQLLREMMRAPGNPALSAALPEGVTDADVIGVKIEGDTALINFTQNFASACAGMDATQERNMIYAIVNTLTELEGVSRVRMYVDGEQTQLAGHLFLPGEFLPNSGLIVE